MSSRDAHLMGVKSKAKALLGAACVSSTLLFGLSGCGDGGIRPMYAPTGNGIGLEQRLASVDVAPIPSRVGQRIRNELIFQNTGGGERAEPKYRLEITIRESIASTLAKSTGESLSQLYALDGAFRLIRNSDKKIILQGTSFGRAAFERYPSVYANVRARQDAEDRTAMTIATDIKSRVAAFLSGQKD